MKNDITEAMGIFTFIKLKPFLEHRVFAHDFYVKTHETGESGLLNKRELPIKVFNLYS